MRSTKNEKRSAPVHSTLELARRLGLSRWTVSRVLNGHDGVHPDTASRVREAMRELGFSPNPLAQGLRKGRTNIVGVCLPEIEGFYLSQKLEFLRRSLAAHGYHVMVAMTNGDIQEEAEALSRFRVLRAAGVILFASQLAANSEPVRQIQDAQIPLVMVDPVTGLSAESVCVDRAVGMREAVHHLFELGHRHIATLGIWDRNMYGRRRLEAVANAYSERGWNPAEFVHRINLTNANEGFYYEPGRKSAEEVCNFRIGSDKAKRPTAVLAVNDRVAIGLIDGLRTLGVRVPEDISVIGYDNMEVGAYLSPQLTTIDAHADALVAQTTARLLQQIRGSEEESEPAMISIPTRLIVRTSTAAVKEITDSQ